MKHHRISFPDDIDWIEDERDRSKLGRTETEWLAEYPQEISQVFEEKIIELRHEVRALRRSLAKQVRNINERKSDEVSGWFAKEVLKATDAAKISELDAKIGHFTRLLRIASHGPSDWDSTVSSAREASIYEIVSQDCSLRRSGRNYVSLCPLHKERHPSFYVNPERNSFRCFGCGVFGDSIAYAMLRYQLDFKQAVHMLAGGIRG